VRDGVTRPVPTVIRFAALRRWGRPAERAWAVALLSLTSGAYLSVIAGLTGGEAQDPSEDPLPRLILFPLYAVMGWLIITHPRGFARVAWRGRLALALVGLAGVSVIWSEDPGLTLRRAVSLLAPTTFGLILSLRFSTRELLRLLAVTFGMAAVLSVIVALALPGETISRVDYGSVWRGVFENKNSLGRSMALAVAVFALMALDGRQYRRIAWLGVAGTLCLVFLARSMGSLVTAVALLALIPLFRSLGLRFTTTVAVCTVSILLGGVFVIIVAANAEPIFTLLGRDATLTGRTDIWAAVLASVGERPWLGYGYNAFWHQWGGPSASVLSSVGWETPNGHNGLLDLWLELGFVGVGTLLLGLMVVLRAAVVSARRADSPAGLWPLVFLSHLALINVSMSAFLRPHSLYWILYVALLSSDLLTKAGKAQPVAVPGPSDRFRRVPPLPRVLGGVGQASLGVRRFYKKGEPSE